MSVYFHPIKSAHTHIIIIIGHVCLGERKRERKSFCWWQKCLGVFVQPFESPITEQFCKHTSLANLSSKFDPFRGERGHLILTLMVCLSLARYGGWNLQIYERSHWHSFCDSIRLCGKANLSWVKQNLNSISRSAFHHWLFPIIWMTQPIRGW